MYNKLKNLKVAILSPDLKRAQKLSLLLRSFDIYASVYIRLDEYMKDYPEANFDFNLIDIRSLEQGSLKFVDFNHFKTGQLKAAFVYDKESRSELTKIHNSHYYGLLREDVYLKSQVRSLLNIILKEQESSRAIATLKKEMRSSNINNLKLERESIGFNESISCYESFSDLLNILKNSDDFLSSFSSALNDWKDCYSFSILSFNEHSGKLQSLNINSSKYKMLPSLELNKKSILRNDFFTMLEQAYENNFSQGLKAISISRDNRLVLVGGFSSDLKEEKAWSYFSHSLSLLSSDTFEVPDMQPKSDFVSFLETIDDEYFNKVKSNLKYLTIDLRPLVQLVSHKYTSRFYWDNFLREFENFLQFGHNIDLKIVNNGVFALYVGTENLKLKETYDILKSKIKDFKYWDFFEDKNITFVQKNYPSINLTPTSSSGILRSQFDQGRVNLSNQLMN